MGRPALLIALSALFLTSLGVCVAQSPAPGNTAPQQHGTVCTIANIPTPRSDGRPIPDYRAIVQRRIESCWWQLPTPAPAGSADTAANAAPEQRQQCDPRNPHRTDISAYETLVDCVSYEPHATPEPRPTPTVLFRSSVPILYVFLPSPAPGSTTGIDNTGSELLWTVATQMQADFSPNQQLLVMPEPAWAASDFNNQCLGDPDNTAGGLDIGAWSATSGGDNWLIVNNGWTQTAYMASLLTCESGAATIVGAFNVSGHSYRNELSLMPLFLYSTYRLASLGGSNQAGTGVLAGLAVAGSSSQLASITLGNVKGVVTVPRAYIDSADNLDTSIISWCVNNKPTTAVAIKLCVLPKDDPRMRPKPWSKWGKCTNPSEAALHRIFC